MKKLLILSNLFFIGIIVTFILHSCNNANKTLPVKDNVISDTNQNETGTNNYCEPCNASNRIPTDFLLNSDLLFSMTGKYNEQLIKANSNDARSIWFDLERLKLFISEIEKANCTENCNKLSLGIRMYYGRYPSPLDKDFPQIAGLDPSVKDMHTLFMVPTYYNDATQLNVDFDPRNMKACTPAPLDGSSTVVVGLTNDQKSMNHGGLIPPPDPAATRNYYKEAGAYFLQ